MQQKIKLVRLTVVALALLLAPLAVTSPVLAADATTNATAANCDVDITTGKPLPCKAVSDCSLTDTCKGGGKCGDINQCDLIDKYINPAINLVSILIGVAVVISITIGGIQYGSSGGDSQKVTAAKNRIRNSLLALVTFLFLYAMLNFLIPGGLV
jgi:hypothetical protein